MFPLYVYIVDDLKTVSRVVAGVDLNDRLLEFIITLFDEDGKLNNNVCLVAFFSSLFCNLAYHHRILFISISQNIYYMKKKRIVLSFKMKSLL